MWTDEIESLVMTKVKHGVRKAVGTEFKDLNFTTQRAVNKSEKFPCVYIERLPGMELAQSLDGTEIQAGSFSYQIKVTDNTSQATAERIISEATRIMKTMRFTIVQTPKSISGQGKYIEVARFRRIIAQGDIL